MDDAIVYMEELWNIIETALDFFAESNAALWSEVSAEDLEDEAKRMMKLTKATNKSIRWSKAYQGIDKANKNFLNTTPLISSLHHESPILTPVRSLVKNLRKGTRSQSTKNKVENLRLFFHFAFHNLCAGKCHANQIRIC